MMGCHHSSVDSYAPTILLPWVRVQAHHLCFFHLKYLCYICHLKRTEINKKRPGLAHFLKKNNAERMNLQVHLQAKKIKWDYISTPFGL